MATSTSHLHKLIAYYLAQNYPTVLPAFLHAADVPPPDLSSPPKPDLRTLITDYLSHELSNSLGQVQLNTDGNNGQGSAGPPATDGSWQNWSLSDMMQVPMEQDVGLKEVVRVIEGISAANLLTVGVHDLPRREFDTVSATYRASTNRKIVTTSVDKTVKVIDWISGEVEQIIEPSRAAVLAFDIHPENPRYLLTGSMDGSTVLTDLITSTPVQTFLSAKFVVRVKFSKSGHWLATASYDHSIVIYEAKTSAFSPPPTEDDIPLDEEDRAEFACDPTLRYEERHRINVGSNPEAILFHEDKWLMYTLRDSHLLYYVRLPSSHVVNEGIDETHRLWETKTKSFNPHPMDTHVSFSVLDLALHPSGKIVACLTGDHRGTAGERILLYGVEPEDVERLGCLWTGGDGDDYVLPRMAWLPNGSGLVTTTPTGYLNLVSLAGERRSSLKVHGATELGQGISEVVRDCCIVPISGTSNLSESVISSDVNVSGAGFDSWAVVSVGYDRRVRLTRWR